MPRSSGIPQVIIVGECGDEVWESLHQLIPGAAIAAAESSSPEEMAGAEVFFVWDFRTTAFAPLHAAAPKLRWIHAASAGVDHVLIDSVIRSGQTVTNARGVFERPIAEYVLGLLLMHIKGLLRTRDSQRQSRWDYRETDCLAGTKALVVGMGSVGTTVAELLSANGVRVRGIRRSGRPQDGVEQIVTPDRMPGLLPWADWVILAAALTPESRYLLDRSAIANLSPSAYVINVGRGALIEEEALLDALEKGAIAGAALDVFLVEPLPPDHRAWGIPSLYVSPHMSADVTGWKEEVVRIFAENLRRYQKGEMLMNVVDKNRGY